MGQKTEVASKRHISDRLLLAEQEAARLRTALAQVAAEISALKAELKRRAKQDNCASAAGRVNQETAGLAPAAAVENGEGHEEAPAAAAVAADEAAGGAPEEGGKAGGAGRRKRAREAEGPAAAGEDGEGQEEAPAAAAVAAGEAAGGAAQGGGHVGGARRAKKNREAEWPKAWEKVPFARGGGVPPGACRGCWWIFQGYEGYRPHAAKACLAC